MLLSVLNLTSCLIDGSWLKIVGRWQDVEYPDMELEFTEGGYFYEYLYGKRIGYGEFHAKGKEITLHYLSACGDDNGVSCYITLRFDVNGDTLIITDKYGDIPYKKISNLSTQSTEKVAQLQSDWPWYKNSEIGISFQYPEYMKLETNINHGGTIEFEEIYTSESIGPLVFLFISIIEEPPNELYPEHLRQTDDLIISSAKYRIENPEMLLVDRGITTDLNSINDAIDSIFIKEISGYKAVTYQEIIKESFWGKAYINGTIIYTDTRSIEAIIMGVLEPSQENINGVTIDYIDNVWENFIRSLVIDS